MIRISVKVIVAVGIISLINMGGCITPPEYDIVPEITFQTIDKTNAKAGEDSLIVSFTFTDGDGDLGVSDTQSTINAWLIDNRTNFPYTYQIPFIPQKGTSNAISGTIHITVSPLTISCRPDHPIRDTLSYSIYIRDRAEHKSNVITTPDIYLKCN